MYANTCWGLLGLAVTIGLAVLGLPSQYEWLQPCFLGTAIACGIASVVCFGWPMREKANRAKLKELCTNPYRAVKLMEPSHVTILGLVIALCGVDCRSLRCKRRCHVWLPVLHIAGDGR